MTGEVRLVEEEALNLPGAAAMAAEGSIERGLSMVDHWGPYARGVSRLHRLPEVSLWPGVIGAGRGSEVVCWRGWRSRQGFDPTGWSTAAPCRAQRCQ